MMNRQRLQAAAAVVFVVAVVAIFGGNAGKTKAETDNRISNSADRMVASMMGDELYDQSGPDVTVWWILIGAGAALGVAAVVMAAVSFTLPDETRDSVAAEPPPG